MTLADLCLAHVEQALTRHRADVCAAAKELQVSRTDLRRLTWRNPSLLRGGLELCDLYVARCTSLMIQALYSNNAQKRRWGVGQLLASPLAAGCSLALAPRPKVKSNKPPSEWMQQRKAAAKRAR
jgi:hypothetical protein